MGGDNLSKPILYKANETDFTTLGLGVLIDELGTFAIEERNGQFYAEMEYPIDGKHFKELKNDRIIKADASNDLKDQRFKIIRIQKAAKGIAKIEAEHVSNLTADKQLAPNVGYRGDAQTAGNIWLNNITDEHPFTFYSDITTNGGGHWEVDEVENARQALGGVQGSLLDTYGGEYRFDNYRISLLKQRGNDNGIPIMYGKNLVDLEQEEEIANTYTSVMPYAIHQPEGADEPVIITLPEYFIDSEHVDKYARRKILKVNFTTDEIETVSELRERTKRYIRENDVGVPKVNLRVNFVDLAKTLDYKEMALIEEINLCDWVVVYFEKLGIKTRAKVIKTKWNSTLERYEEIEIGEARASLTQSLNSVVDGRMNKVEKQVNEVRASANGKNANHYGYAEPLPQDSKENDTWFKPIADGDTEMYRYNGYQWEYVLSTADTTENARKLEELYPIIEEAKQQAIDSKQEAIDEAEKMVEEQDVIYQELFDGYDAAVDDLTGSIDETNQKAIDALTKAGESGNLAQAASDGVQRVEQDLVNVRKKTDDALSKSDNALTKANNIPSTIDNVIIAKGLVSGDWVNTQINDVTGEINYAIESVQGDIPEVVMGVEWDKSENSALTRTDYVESYVNLEDYNLQTAKFNLSMEGLEQDLAKVEREKLDNGIFTSFKNNEYANDINGIRNRLTRAEENKLDGETFQDFRRNDYRVTVDGFEGDIQKLEREKLDERTFADFKTNEYQLTVDGFDMALTSVSGSIPTLVMGVEWSRTESSKMTRTDDAAEEDLTNYDSPDYIMGVKWDKESNPAMVRIRDTEETTSKEEFELFLADYNFKADGWDATNAYITNNSSAINSLINNAHGWSQTISYVDENRTAFNETVSQVDSYKQTLGSNGEKITQLVMTDETFVTRIGQLEGNIEGFVVGVEWNKETSPEMARTGYMDDWTETQVAQLADSWVLNIKSGSDIKTAINATTDGLRFKGELIHIESGKTLIDNAVIKSAHIDALNVSKLVGTTGEFTALRSKIITADSIDANHLNVTTGMIDELFATNVLVNRLTSKTAFIEDVKAIEISADKITAGELWGNSVTASGINVNTIVGLTSNFVQSYWNSATGGSVRATGDGIISDASNGAQTLIQNGVTLTRNPGKNTIGYMGYAYNDGRPWYSIQATLGSHFQIRMSRGAGNLNKRAFYIMSGGTESYINTDYIYLNPAKYVTIQGDLNITGNTNFAGNNLSNVRNLHLEYGSWIYDDNRNSGLRLVGGTDVRLYTNGISGSNLALQMDNSHIYARRTLSMEGYNITNQSDERLKRDVTNTTINSLEAIKSWRFVGYNWKDEEMNSRLGRQFGIIAQDTPDLALYNAESDTWNINSSKQIMMNSHGIQQLAFKHIAVANTVKSHADIIDRLEYKLTQANKRIEKLERKIA